MLVKHEMFYSFFINVSAGDTLKIDDLCKTFVTIGVKWFEKKNSVWQFDKKHFITEVNFFVDFSTIQAIIQLDDFYFNFGIFSKL